MLARGALRRPRLSRARQSAGDGAAARRREREVYDSLAGAFLTTPIYAGEALAAGTVLDGPAVIQYASSTLALCSGQRARVGPLLSVEVTNGP